MNDISARYLTLIEELINSKIIKDSKELAVTIGVSTSSMTEISKGRTNVGLSIIHKTVSKFPEINLDWLIRGDGNIFNTKSTENLTKSNSKANGKDIGKERKVQKTLPNDGTITHLPTKPTSSIVNDNTGVYTTTSEVKPNYMSNLTDEEIDNVIRTQFREHLFEMVESGRYYPAAMVTAMMENQAAQLTELQKKLSEMETKLNSCTPSKNNDHLNPQHKHK